MLLKTNRAMWQLLLSLLTLNCCLQKVSCEIQDNTLNEDGSYSFRHTNNDIGRYYHSASGSADNIVRGRYGSRSPATGQVEEVVYTAGPRGFRANGPQIHRKMDLAQFPVRPLGTSYDPLADPFDDPTYSFSYRTADQSRSENSDATGKVRGLYSYSDDVGDLHTVRYAAGATTGFEVVNAVPDSPSIVNYNGPLYKAPPRTRGKISVQRGPDGTYKLLATGPDHRRAESRASDGMVRGTYSFLDDQGIQRTVEYIAGAGIGYRVLQNLVGPGSHVNPSVADLRLNEADRRLANDLGRGQPIDGNEALGIMNRRVNKVDMNLGESDDTTGSDRWATGTESRSNTDRIGSTGNNNNRGITKYQGGYGARRPDVMMNKRMRPGATSESRNTLRPANNKNGPKNVADEVPDPNWNRDYDNYAGTGSFGNGLMYDAASSTKGNNYNLNDDDISDLPPATTANRKILEIERDRDWVNRYRDSSLIKNVGKWYIGLPPGQTVRAHVQNIDLLPLGGRRVQSPSEALRQDELAEMVSSFESDRRPKRRSKSDKTS